MAFDTGPGNVMIDHAARVLFNKAFDAHGAIAASGQVQCSKRFRPGPAGRGQEQNSAQTMGDEIVRIRRSAAHLEGVGRGSVRAGVGAFAPDSGYRASSLKAARYSQALVSTRSSRALARGVLPTCRRGSRRLRAPRFHFLRTDPSADPCTWVGA